MAGNDSYTVTLLHMDGADGSTTFTDEGAGQSEAHTWTPGAGGDAQIDTDQSKFGGASAYFTGHAGDYIATFDSTDYQMGSGDFTVDFWVRRGATGALQLIDGQADNGGANTTVAWGFRFTASNTVTFLVCYGSTDLQATSTVTITDTTTWHHLAGVRNGTGTGNLKLFIDGVLRASANLGSNTVNNSSNYLSIGRCGEYASYLFTGWIDEYRISKGIARWTTNFDVPTEAYSSETPTPVATTMSVGTDGKIIVRGNYNITIK